MYIYGWMQKKKMRWNKNRTTIKNNNELNDMIETIVTLSLFKVEMSGFVKY